ncbi:MAG TPA: chemotaxis protein CheW [Burkholderiales bacterium]|nr:chemotaxis protein CheW [Burkholderiales bacterium]
MPDAGVDVVETSAALRFLTFRVDERVYALRAEDVSEVVRVPAMARVPQSPEALLGIANLRGSVLPAVSLRGLLGMAVAEIGSTSRAIVLDTGAPVALVVDSVDSLVAVAPDSIETQQADLATEPGERVVGAFKAGGDGRVAKIVDIKGLLNAVFTQRARPERQARRIIGTSDLEQFDTQTGAAAMLITFDVAGQEFALDLDAVQEILPAPSTLTAVPRAEALVLGMTSLRETLLPLLSLRGLLGFPPAPTSSARAKVVVMKVAGAQVGLMVDRARAIVAAEPGLVDPIPPVLASRTGGEARIRAIYRGESGRRLISILAPEQLFREDVMQRLNAGRDKQASQTPQAAATQRKELHFLVFRLGDDEFGLPIETVDEVAQVPEQITRLPKTPKFLEGVINLRGDVLPVIDQRRRFDMPGLDRLQGRRLIVVRTEHHRAGLIVDSVSDVLRTPADSVEPAPDLTEETGRLVRGVINLEESNRIVLVLDPTELLTKAEQGLLDAFQAETGRTQA